MAKGQKHISAFEQKVIQKFKQKKIEGLSDDKKSEYRNQKIEEIFSEIADNKNRYIFYCPDILVVNNLVKIIYDMAYHLGKAGFNVLVLHEISGFKCKWILNNEHLKDYNNIKIDYIIKKKSKKSKKEKNNYSFKPTDTLIVPDVFQEVLENILELKLVQKVLLVSSYLGLGSLKPGTNYKQLDVTSFIFLEKKLMEDYASLFKEKENNFYLLDSYSINKDIFNYNSVKESEIYPTIAISAIGNVKLASQITSIFYNLYPRLSVFSFKIIDRSNYEEYTESLLHSCLFLILDETMGFRQIATESMTLGIPTLTFQRRELTFINGMKEEVCVLSKDPFEIAEVISLYCIHWLAESNHDIREEVLDIVNKMQVEHSDLEFKERLIECVDNIKKDKVKMFASIQQSFDKAQSSNAQKEKER